MHELAGFLELERPAFEHHAQVVLAKQRGHRGPEYFRIGVPDDLVGTGADEPLELAADPQVTTVAILRENRRRCML